MRVQAPEQDPTNAPSAGAKRSESGFTVVELLLAMTLLAGVMTALVQVFTAAGPVAGRDQARSAGIMDAQTGLAKMTRDLRQAQTINSATATAVDFNATIDGVSQRILYDCSTTDPGTTYKRCVKATSSNLTVAPLASAGVPVITRLANGATAVFSYSPSASAPTYVSVHVEVPRQGGYEEQGVGYQNDISFDGGVYLPNRGTQ